MGDMDPHIYAVAEEAYKQMARWVICWLRGLHSEPWLFFLGGGQDYIIPIHTNENSVIYGGQGKILHLS